MTSNAGSDKSAGGTVGFGRSSDEQDKERVMKALTEQGWQVVNIDATLVAQAPKIAPYRQEMRCALARTLGIRPEQVNVKATTEEHLGFTGEGLGISAHAVALIQRAES